MAAIEKLQSLYRQLDSLASAGDDVVADLRKEINNLELAYLKEDVLPQVASLLGAKIKNLRCGLDCSIQYDEDGIINYSFCTTDTMLMVKDSVDAKLCNEAVTELSQATASKAEVESPINVSSISDIRIVDYSEKAIAVYGDTRQFADTFKTFGGYFNARLKEGPGWVFSKKRRTEIENLLAPYSTNQSASRKTDAESGNLFSSVGMENPDSRTDDDWIKRLTDLNCSTNKGIKAPHKAIFILAIIDNIRKGYIKDNRVYPTINLIEAFKRLWSKYVPAKWPFSNNIYQPFVHLSSERFYALELVSPRAKYDFNQNWNKTQTLRYFKYGILDDKAFTLLKNRSFSSRVEDILIETYLKSSKEKAQYTTISQKEILSDFEDFKVYLRSLTSQTGKPYSDSSIKLYANSLRGAYVRSIVATYTPTENIEDISSPDILQKILDKADADSIIGLTNRSIALAVKMYCDFRALNDKPYTSAIPDAKQDDIPVIMSQDPTRKSKPIEIKSITAEHIYITEGNPTSMIVQFVNEIGPELIADMNINYLGGMLVSKSPNPKYIHASKKLTEGYWINTNSSTRTKIDQIKTICNNLGMEVNIELGDNDTSISEDDFSNRRARTMFSLNGHSPLNKRQSVLACVRLFMALNHNVPYEVVERNFPPELQGNYGVVAKLAKVRSRISHGYDDERRYFLAEDQILKAKDGVEFVVCHQWGNQFPKFQEHIRKRFGWTLEEIK